MCYSFNRKAEFRFAYRGSKGYAIDERITDKITVPKISIKGQDKLLLKLRKSDALVVWKLDRLSRAMFQRVILLSDFKEREREVINILIRSGLESAKA